MKTADAIKHFGSQEKLGAALRMRQPSVSKWGEYPPPRRQLQLERLTQGALAAEPDAHAWLESMTR